MKNIKDQNVSVSQNKAYPMRQNIMKKSKYIYVENTVGKNQRRQYLQDIEENDDNTYKIITKSIYQENENQLIENYEQKSQIQQYQLCVLFKNRYTYVELMFKPDLNTFVIKKQYKQESDSFEKEKHFLKLLKGQRITLDIIPSNQNDINSFEQIAGKINLSKLKQKTKSKHLFETYFFILLEKLNRLHQIGLAHSDIKPDNIVISYNNEPFFIDFDGSVLLSNYDEYLQYYTQKYNLNVYVKKLDNENFQIKRCEDEEEVKLCDKTQLALTFLNLLSNDQNQLKIFSSKDFNKLIQILFNESKNKNSLILSIISRILNEADPDIKIVGDIQQQIFHIDNSTLQKELQLSNDVVFVQKKNIYKVNRIDEFSIKLIYLLDKSNRDLDINPNHMVIIPQPEMIEYQYICKKFNIIEQYQNKLINGSYLEEQEFINLCHYLKVQKNKKCKILINNDNYQELLINIRKSDETLEKSLIFKQSFLYEFIKFFNEELPNYHIQTFQLYGERIECRINKIYNQEHKIFVDYLRIILVEEIQFDKQEYFKFIQSNYKIKSLEIIFENYQIEDEIYLQWMQKLLSNLINMVNTMESGNKQIMSIQFIRKIQLQKNYMFKLPVFQNIINKYDRKEKERNKLIIRDIIDQIDKFEKQSDCNIQMDQQIILCVKSMVQQKQDTFSSQTIQIIQNLIKMPQKLVIKFFNCILEFKQLWLDLKIMIASIEYQSIDITLVNCQFNQDIVNILKEIQSTNSYAKYEFLNEYNMCQNNNQQNNRLQCEIQVEYNILQHEKGLKFQFFRQFAKTAEQQNQNSKEKNQIKQKDNKCNQKENQQTNQNTNQKQRIEQEKNNDQITIDGIQNILSNDYTYKNLILQDQKISIGNQSNLILIDSLDKQTNIIQNKDDIDFVISDLNQKVHYKRIKVLIQENSFSYIDKYEDKNDNRIRPSINIKYYCNNQENSILDQFYQLYLAINNNCYHQEVINSFVCSQQDISLTKSYLKYDIQQNLKSQAFNDDEKDQIEEDKLFKYYFPEKNELQYIVIHLIYKIVIKDPNKEQDNDIQSQQIKNQILNNSFLENLSDFQEQHGINKSPISSHIFKSEDYVVEFLFDNFNIGDKAFQILIQRIDELFSQNQKIYSVCQCGLTKQSLNFIHEFIKKSQQEQRIKFDLIKNNISYYDFKNLQKIEQLIINEFKDYMSVTQTNYSIDECESYYGLMKYNPQMLYKNGQGFNRILFLESFQQSSQKQSQIKYKILLSFEDIHFSKPSKTNSDQQFHNEQDTNLSQKDKSQTEFFLDNKFEEFIQILDTESFITFVEPKDIDTDKIESEEEQDESFDNLDNQTFDLGSDSDSSDNIFDFSNNIEINYLGSQIQQTISNIMDPNLLNFEEIQIQFESKK